MSWLDRFKPHKGDVYRPGHALPEPGYETATGRKLYTVQQIRTAYEQGQRDSLSLLRRARNLLSHPPGWVDTPSNSESRYALSVEIAEHLNGLNLSEACTEKQTGLVDCRVSRTQTRSAAGRQSRLKRELGLED